MLSALFSTWTYHHHFRGQRLEAFVVLPCDGLLIISQVEHLLEGSSLREKAPMRCNLRKGGTAQKLSLNFSRWIIWRQTGKQGSTFRLPRLKRGAWGGTQGGSQGPLQSP